MKLNIVLDEMKRLKWVDLTHGFGTETPRWPGFDPLKREVKLDFDQYPVRAYMYTFPGQYGTHIDVPAHADVGGRTLEEIDLKECVLPLCVINCVEKVKNNPDYALSIKDIMDYEDKYGIIPRGSFVAMRTDWYKRWPYQKAFENCDSKGQAHYPGWSIEAVEFLITQRKIGSIGHETFDTDPPANKNQSPFKAECFILKSDKYQVEMLANLDQVTESGGIIICLFAKQVGGTGFPVRCFAICPYR